MTETYSITFEPAVQVDVTDGEVDSVHVDWSESLTMIDDERLKHPWTIVGDAGADAARDAACEFVEGLERAVNQALAEYKAEWDGRE